MPFDGVSEPKSSRRFDSSNGHWLGLSVHHRRLLDAVQDGWLRPQPDHSGLLLGTSTFVTEQYEVGKHTITAHIKFDVQKLPRIDVFVFRDGRWLSCKSTDLESSDGLLYWPGALPTFAVSALHVASHEERIRLSALARQFSNVCLPVDITVDSIESIFPQVRQEPTEVVTKIDIPPEEDAIHGAMSMAVWAVPRIDPWLELMVKSLSNDIVKLSESAVSVEAYWWRATPWSKWSEDVAVEDFQDCLWRSAIDVFREISNHGGIGPVEIASQIKSKADNTYYAGCSPTETSNWLDDTNRILRAESVFGPQHWQHCPVGMAIQLVLTRPEPDNFKTWHRDILELPPRVWWSAAALCGLRHGYKKLSLCFRGEAPLQEVLAVHALQLSNPSLQNLNWPFLGGEPGWRRDGDEFMLFWGNKSMTRKSGNARSRWYVADYKNEVVRQTAEELAKDLKWSCLRQQIRLTSGHVYYSGPGKIEVRDNELAIHGEIDVQLPSNTYIHTELDVESFRHLVTVAAGRLPDPPKVITYGSQSTDHAIPGLNYVPNFLSETEEAELVKKIDQSNWIYDIKRRVQHYGWRYDYINRQIDPGMRIDKLPDWALEVAQRLVEQELVPQMPDQLIVNEYIRDQGIGRHVDKEPNFADGIAMISLLESWEMVFRKKDNSKVKRNVMLDSRSVAVMSGPARYQWTHEIPYRKSEPGPKRPDGKRPRKLRKRRLSLTFRKVLEENLRR